MVKKVLLVAFASLSLSLSAPVPANEDLPPTEVHRRQPRPFFVFDNSIPGTHYAGQPMSGPKFQILFPFSPLPWSLLLPPIPSISGSGLLNERNLIRVYNLTNAATNATLGYYLINPFENYNLNDIIGLIRGNGRSVDEPSFDVRSNSEIPALNVQQLNELLQMYNQQLTSARQGVTFNTPNMLPTSLYPPNVQGSPYITSPYLSQFNQYNPFVAPNSMFAPSATLSSPLPEQESAVSGLRFGITAPIPGVEIGGAVSAAVEQHEDSDVASATLSSPLPGQESAVSSLRFGITATIPGVETGAEVSAAIEQHEDSDVASADLSSPLPGQESAVSGLRFGISAPIPGVETGGVVSAAVEQHEDSDVALDGMEGGGVGNVRGVVEQHANGVTESVREETNGKKTENTL